VKRRIGVFFSALEIPFPGNERIIFDGKEPGPERYFALPASTNAAELLGNLDECPCKGMKCKAYHVSPWRNGDRTEDHIGLQDLSRLAVHG